MAELRASDRRLTSEEYLLTDYPHTELIDGRVVPVTPPGYEHGTLAGRVLYLLQRFLDDADLGEVTAESGFCIRRNPDTVRAPDVAFLTNERLEASALEDGEWIAGYPACAPDLAVEVVSPSDRRSEVEAKAKDWLEAGCREVWLVMPSTREIIVWETSGGPRRLGADATLTSAMLPGFALAVESLFRRR